jgi:hypothetical protein
MSLVGSLLYAAVWTRPDLGFAVQSLTRHFNAVGPEHLAAAKRVLRYVQGTLDLSIRYGGDGESEVVHRGAELEGYCDSDWAGDRDTRRSTTAYVFMLNGGVVSWNSRLQTTVALSSTEAEYMAACAAAQEAVFLRRLLTDLGYVQYGPTVIHADNQGCIALSKNPIHHKRTKHIDVRYHYVRDLVDDGVVQLEYIHTNEQLADVLTKALPREQLVSLRRRVMGY